MKDQNVVEQLVKRAERAGFKAIVVTVDTPRLGRRVADIKNRRSTLFLTFIIFSIHLFSYNKQARRFVLPPHLTLKNFEGLDIDK